MSDDTRKSYEAPTLRAIVPSVISIHVSGSGVNSMVVQYLDERFSIDGLERAGLVKLSTMDRMILNDLARKLQMIAAALEARR